MLPRLSAGRASQSSDLPRQPCWPLVSVLFQRWFIWSSGLFERESGGGLVEAVGSLEESQVAACLQQLTLWQGFVWRLIAAVGPTAEDCVSAGLRVV